MFVRIAATLLVALFLNARPAAADDLVLFAAGSLRDTMGEVTAAFTAKTGTTVKTAFGPSGLPDRQS